MLAFEYDLAQRQQQFLSRKKSFFKLQIKLYIAANENLQPIVCLDSKDVYLYKRA